MTPLHLKILIHYYISPVCNFTDGDDVSAKSKAGEDYQQDLLRHELIKTNVHSRLSITKRGKELMESLLSIGSKEMEGVV